MLTRLFSDMCRTLKNLIFIHVKKFLVIEYKIMNDATEHLNFMFEQTI